MTTILAIDLGTTERAKAICFFAEGQPKGQPRVRAFAMKMGGKYTARVFDPGTAEAWKNCIAIAAREHCPKTPLDGPVRLFLSFDLKRPKAHFKRGTLRQEAPEFCVSKPDADNYAKAVMDALTILRFWNDDAQVCELYVSKRYSPGGITGVHIRIEKL